MVWSCSLTGDINLEVIDDKNLGKDILSGLVCYKWNKVELICAVD
jgi:hypothetical protein